jgi:hypothetical protein
VQIDRVSLAPGEAMVDPVQGDIGFVRSGPAVTLAAVESGAVTLFGAGGQGDGRVSAGVAGAEAGVVVGSGNVEARANTEPIAATVEWQPEFGAGGSDIADCGTIDEVGGETGIGGAGTSGAVRSQGEGARTANVEPNAGARAGGGGADTIVVTGTVEGITVMPGESEPIPRVASANASGVLESSGATEFRNTGSETAVASILTLVPGVYMDTGGTSVESGASAGGE